MRGFFFLLRLVVVWFLTLALLVAITSDVFGGDAQWGDAHWPLITACAATIAFVLVSAFSHLRRVRLIAGQVNATTLSNRQRRQIEMPIEAGEAFDLLEAAIRELPGIETVDTARDSLQVRAKLQRIDPYGGHHRFSPMRWFGSLRNQILATVTPGDGIGSVTLICEPEAGAWSDWYRVDDGTNLENAEAVTRAITRRIADRRRHEQAAVRQNSTEKELTVAKLSLLHAQVEPHFLYNTLASAQYLTRSDPPLADEMIGNLITYLRHSLPRTEDTPSTLGEELERARAYLDILKIRMGPRLGLQIDVPSQLLDEIKHHGRRSFHEQLTTVICGIATERGWDREPVAAVLEDAR